MTLGDIRTRVARAVGLSTTVTADTDLIDAWANEAVIQFLKDTKIDIAKAAMSVTAQSGDYSLDSDILAFQDIWYEPASGGDALLEQVDSSEIENMRLRANTSGSYPRYYALEGAHLLMLYPAPQSNSDLIHIKYVPRPSATMSTTAHSPSDATRGNIPAEFHPYIEAYAKWKAGEAEEHKPSDIGMKWQAEYERGVAKVKSDLNRKAGIHKGKMRVGPFRVWPPTPGTDVKVF